MSNFVPLTVDTLSIVPRLEGDTLHISMSGAVEMRDPGDVLNPYWTLIDEEARRRKLKLVELDVLAHARVQHGRRHPHARPLDHALQDARGLLPPRAAIRPQRHLATRVDPDAGQARTERRRLGGDRWLT